MAELWYGHFDSTPEDERLLLAEDWARFIRGFVTNGIRNGGSCLQVLADTGMKLRVDCGVANIEGYIFEISEDAVGGRYHGMTVETAHPSYPRIDRVVLRLDRTIAVRAISPVIIRGTASATPTAPVLTRDKNIYEISLAQVRVNAGALSITAGNVTDERFNTELCGLMNSVLGLDPSAWQTQFDAFLADLKAQEQAFLDGHGVAFSNKMAEWQAAWNAKIAAYDAWFATINVDLQRYSQFNFDNLAALPGTTKTTTFPAGKMLETITTTAGGAKVATRERDFTALTVTEKVYQSNGVSILRQSTITTTFPDGGIKDVIV